MKNFVYDMARKLGIGRKLKQLPALTRVLRAFVPDARDLLLRRLPSNAICAEIGVWKGDFSERILRQTEPKELHLVDPWRFQPEFPRRLYGGGDGGAASRQEMDEIYRSVTERFSSHANIVAHRMPSHDMRDTFAEGYFDWIYIDGDHGLEGVLSDLETCWHLVKPSGLIAVDDYYWKDADGSLSVKTGVQQFIELKNVTQSWLIGDQFLFLRD